MFMSSDGKFYSSNNSGGVSDTVYSWPSDPMCRKLEDDERKFVKYEWPDDGGLSNDQKWRDNYDVSKCD